MDINNIGNNLENLNSNNSMCKEAKGSSEQADVELKTCKHNYGFLNKGLLL